MKDIEKDVRVEDIHETNKAGEPNLWREVADLFGPEVVIFISKRAGGSKIDVLSYKKLIAPALDRHCGITVR